MFAILKKDLYQQRWIVLSALFLLVSFALFLPSGAAFALSVAQYPVILLVSVILAVITTEGWEEKSHGYDFLGSLPISHAGIITAKFTALFLVCGLSGVLAWLTSSVKFDGSPLEPLLMSVLALSIGGSLVVGAICYSGIYVLGLARFTRAALVVTMLAQVLIVGIGIQQFRGGTEENPLVVMFGKILTVNPWAFIGMALGIFLVLMGVTACFRKRI